MPSILQRWKPIRDKQRGCLPEAKAKHPCHAEAEVIGDTESDQLQTSYVQNVTVDSRYYIRPVATTSDERGDYTRPTATTTDQWRLHLTNAGTTSDQWRLHLTNAGTTPDQRQLHLTHRLTNVGTTPDQRRLHPTNGDHIRPMATTSDECGDYIRPMATTS